MVGQLRGAQVLNQLETGREMVLGRTRNVNPSCSLSVDALQMF